MGSRIAAWVCAWAALAVMGCGKSEGGAEPISQADLPGRVASLLCESMATCCKSSGFPLDAAACKAAQTAELQDNLGETAGQRVHYDAQAAGDCLAAVAPMIQCGDVDGDDAPACERIFVGSIALGKPCDSSRECAPVADRSVYCESDDGVSPSVCTASTSTASPHGKAGDACGGTCFEDDDCGFVRAPVPSPQPGGVPEPQAAIVDCYRADGLFCDVGRCAPLRALGEVCVYDACRAGAFCDSSTGRCRAPQPDGSPCDSNDNCQSDNCDDRPGDPTIEAVAGVCVSATHVTATQCERASGGDPPSDGEPPPDSTEPADDPGPGAP